MKIHEAIELAAEAWKIPAFQALVWTPSACWLPSSGRTEATSSRTFKTWFQNSAQNDSLPALQNAAEENPAVLAGLAGVSRSGI
jgi:hypothetical protein